ncbi:hypothetical protein [Cryptosporangium sp. NPDC048952]|uniref:hypothetical protein n=1 Tax=Cryptosporangium sp. NPDC048952 TaxID=3363961 RepID=UPI003713E5F4
MESVRGLVRRFPVLSFFTLAFGLSWVAWTPYVFGNTGLGVEPDFHLPTGPAGQLVGMLPGAYLGPLTAAFVVTALTEGRAGLRSGPSAWCGGGSAGLGTSRSSSWCRRRSCLRDSWSLELSTA